MPARHLAAVPAVLVCGHCAHRPGRVGPSRVCPACGLGLLLAVAPGDAPGPGDAVLLVDGAGRVVGASRGAEARLGRAEPDLLGRPVHAVLGGAVVARVVAAGPPPVDLVLLGPAGASGPAGCKGGCSPGAAEGLGRSS